MYYKREMVKIESRHVPKRSLLMGEYLWRNTQSGFGKCAIVSKLRVSTKTDYIKIQIFSL